jgi:hypothetical protein
MARHPRRTFGEGSVSDLQPIVCYARCWACMLFHCYDPPQPHPWAGPDDVEHAAATGQPEPTGNCACSCARPEDGAA